MNTRKSLFVLVLLLTMALTACFQADREPENMSDRVNGIDAVVEDNEVDELMMKDDNASKMTDEKEGISEKSDDMEGEVNNEHDQAIMDESMEKKDDHGETIMEDDKETMDDPDDEMMGEKDDMPIKEEVEGLSDDSMMMTPDWFAIPLTDVRSGESFTIGDLRGKVILIETLAMWCSNCLKQQGQVKILHDLKGEQDDFISLGIDIDPNENADALLSYINKHGFDWMYTVAPVDVSREIGQLYGDQFLNPPSTPMLIIDKDGDVHPLPFGIKRVEELQEALKPFLDGEM